MLPAAVPVCPWDGFAFIYNVPPVCNFSNHSMLVQRLRRLLLDHSLGMASGDLSGSNAELNMCKEISTSLIQQSWIFSG